MNLKDKLSAAADLADRFIQAVELLETEKCENRKYVLEEVCLDLAGDLVNSLDDALHDES